MPPVIMIVDDDPDIRLLLGALLTEEGYAVQSAPDGATVPIDPADPPALILCDVHMPRVDGITFSWRLRSDPRTAAIPIVAMSTGGSVQRAVAEMQAGAARAKPFDVDTVLAIVADYSALPASAVPMPAWLTHLVRPDDAATPARENTAAEVTSAGTRPTAGTAGLSDGDTAQAASG